MTNALARTGFACAALFILPGAALAETRSYDLADFDAVSVATGVTATIAVGGPFAVAAEGDADDLERLEITVRGEELRIERDTRGLGWGRRSGRIEVRVTMPDLAALSASSGSRAEAANIDAGDFEIDASSGASVEASGRCESLTADVSSGARINAEALLCHRARADASSGGSVRLHADESIAADASSGGSVVVAGSPVDRRTDTSSGGSVRIQ